MTTHDRDKIITAAKESGAYISGPVPRWIERFYAIAHEDGRQAERKECSVLLETMSESDWLPKQLAKAIRARSTK